MSDISDLDNEGSNLAKLRFLAHLKEYGVVYAVAYFVAQDMGLLASIATTAGGMC